MWVVASATESLSAKVKLPSNATTMYPATINALETLHTVVGAGSGAPPIEESTYVPGTRDEGDVASPHPHTAAEMSTNSGRSRRIGRIAYVSSIIVMSPSRQSGRTWS
jgi:hypothetical protein